MIDRTRLLQDLQNVVIDLEDDLRKRLESDQPSQKKLRGEYDTARKAGRTAAAWETFRDDQVTQVAVAWVLATVFVRFVEDNGLIDEPWLGGPKLQVVKERYTHWLKQHPHDNDRDYLLHVFAELGKLPGLQPLLAENGHSLVWSLGPTADGARLLREFWLGAGGDAVHDFADPEWGTRFLGDLYQDLSEHAQKKYALLQTPDFIEEFLLDKTLEPALAEFGLKETRIIDPACGSGHFLLGSFARLFAQWQQAEPAAKAPVLAQRALDAVAGVDLNPFAVAIARFRLLVAALNVCGVRRLKDAFDFKIQVAAGDSLLHGRHQGAREGRLNLGLGDEFDFEHFFGSEDRELLHAIFGRSYHAVVGNPPYIVARDRALNALYRERWPEVCHGKYSLGAPFTQLFFELARPRLDEKRAPGFVGMITANSFMKREFGKKLIEEYLGGKVELTGVLDLSGAYIPGHGTPTVILLGRTRTAVGTTIRAVLGIKGEPATPDDPAKGLVWSAIVEQFEKPGSESEFVSCGDVTRERFAAHPWSIGGGGAAELKEQIESSCSVVLKSVAEFIGITAVTGEDDLYLLGPAATAHRLRVERVRPLVVGDELRDWSGGGSEVAVWPYGEEMELLDLSDLPVTARLMWSYRAAISRRKRFGTPMLERGLSWYEWQELYRDKLRTPLSIAFAEVASHNHFVLDRGGKVFKQTAPVIKLPPEATEDDHLGLLGLLNSSVACFWLRQVCFPKGGDHVGNEGARVRKSLWDERYAFNASNIQNMPLPDARPLARAQRLDRWGCELGQAVASCDLRSAADVRQADARFGDVLARAIAAQEELDWECYRLYGLIQHDLTYSGDDLPGLELSQRAFEIVLARQIAAGKTTTTWFARHGSTEVTEIPAHWPKPYRDLVQRRIDCIEKNPDIRLIEQPEYKRRWNVEPFADQLARAQRNWLLDRMEQKRFWPEPKLTTTARFAELLRHDPDFVQVANLYRGRDDYDFDALVRELVTGEGVPFLPVQRYKPSGLRKREVWERTWDLQRREDAGEDTGPIPVPPKYTAADFLPGSWRHRGKLDVPKERFVLYPQAEADDDPTPVFTWAGFDHLQQAKALAAWLIERKEQDGWTADKLKPLYAGLDQLIPWLKQWHNDVDPETQQRLGDYFQGFLDQELRAQGLTIDDVRGWTPPARGRGRGRRAAAKQATDEAEELDA
jgi:SAM-dependent methyltransferase